MYKSKLCPNCKSQTKNPKYCSNKCQQEYQRKIKLATGTAGWKIRNDFIKKRDKFRCKICELNKWNKQPIPIVIDHIDGNPDNNSLDNLRVICPNCDAQLPTYKSRNRGRGRTYRRNRYRSGQSY